MLTSFGVSEALGQAEVNHVHVMLLLANSNEEVVGLDVPVQEVSRVYKLNSLQLLSQIRLDIPFVDEELVCGHLPSDLQA